MAVPNTPNEKNAASWRHAKRTHFSVSSSAEEHPSTPRVRLMGEVRGKQKAAQLVRAQRLQLKAHDRESAG